MSQNLFSVTIFFIVFREALETAIVISVLLSLVDQIILGEPSPSLHEHSNTGTIIHVSHTVPADPESNPTSLTPQRVLRKLKLQVIFGALVGLAIAVAVGGAFIAVWFTQAKNLWSRSEQLWEGAFKLVASVMIFAMGVTMLKMENARAKWRVKFRNAFDNQPRDRDSRSGKWVLFLLPMVTVLREGVEALVFVGGVSLAEPATSIPIAAIVGIICGIACGVIVYQFGSRTTFRIFLICMTNLILLMGAGLFSKAVWAFQENAFIQLIGGSSDDALGTGPGTYDVRGSVWHLDCCSSSSGSWSVFNAVFGWNNSATLGSVLSYVFYWIAVVLVLVYYKFQEGRTKVFKWESTNGKRRRQQREAQDSARETTESPTKRIQEAGMVVTG